MWTRPPANPVPNVPAAIVEFVQLLKDPAWLASMAQAAKDVAEANRLTEEENENVADAVAIIDRAEKISGLQADKDAELAKQAEAQAAKSAGLDKREKQCDDRNTAISTQETVLAKRQDALEKLEQAVARREREAAADCKTNAQECMRLTAWAAELAQEQQNWDAARNLLTKKKVS